MIKPRIILGIETSCDETACAIVKKNGDRIQIVSNVVASSAKLQDKYGGVIPEQAAREQLKSIIPVIQESLNEARVTSREIDAIAVTQGPGLIGSLLVGVETAKVLATIWQKPLVPINHLLGHFYANWINNTPSFPCLGLLVSGGHTDLVLFRDHGKYQYLGGTRDDAAGECFDKCARLLGLPYPGGPNLSKLAEKGDPNGYKLPRPMINSKDLDFSFSGLKTAVLNLVNSESSMVNGFKTESKSSNNKPFTINHKLVINLAASIEDAITDVLVKKTLAAAKKYKTNQIIVAGGVAANQTLRIKLCQNMTKKNSRPVVFFPDTSLCTDNAAYIAAAAFFNFYPIDPLKLQAKPMSDLK